MPRGDDKAAHAEFDAASLSQYGIHANAQEMIDAHRRSISPAYRKAALLPVDEEATAEVLEDLDALREKFGLADDVQVLTAAVRGNALVAAVEYPSGVIEKVVTGANSKYVPPKLTPEQEADAERSAADAEVARQVALLRAEFEQQLAEARDDLTAQLGEEMAKLRSGAPPAGADELPADEDLPLDDEAALEKRLTKPLLEQLAERHDVEVESGDTKATIADKIVAAVKAASTT